MAKTGTDEVLDLLLGLLLLVQDRVGHIYKFDHVSFLFIVQVLRDLYLNVPFALFSV